MASHSLPDRAASYLRTLCLDISERGVGSLGNRAATDFVARTLASFDLSVETPAFDCLDWTGEGARLSAEGTEFAVRVSPYSLGGRFSAPLMVVSTVEALATADVAGKVLLLRGEPAKEPLMPKNFPFWNPEEHQRIIALLEAGQPAAIVTAAARNPQMAGAAYPYPLIEDGDFDIPSVYMTQEEGERLAAFAGREVVLEIRAQRIPARGCNVIATRGPGGRRVVLCAHIDARPGVPGALDNAAGVTVLLLLAELLADYAGELGVEIVALNGEDYYSNPGEQLYLATNAGRMEEIVLGINLDGLGYRAGGTAYSLYECPPDLEAAIRDVLAAHAGLVEGEPWYQGDHGLFIMNGRPALALTSERVWEVMAGFVHTPQDRPEVVDPGKLVEAAQALGELVRRLE